ncbi:tRNA-uridine aminocarboxypropyltransferase [Litoribrevibacter euphylliae]|uniref:tRNA-uridine aminocarboxypropyltransferase n=1 Tax=Litoribrevibacter euphylliae TaxID=1834034 RepID=A0ABV7HEC2_9GAMM
MSNYCPTCLRPKSRCLCSFVRNVQHRTPVFILQHSKERLHPKGTAKLAQLCLSNCTLISGKAFDKTVREITSKYRPLLLWPSDPSLQASENMASDENDVSERKPIALIAIDGTWKKANKIYLSHPQLQSLPKLNIEGRENQYRHRKSPSDQHLSTLEAIYHGLNKLEGHTESDVQQEALFTELLDAQQTMIEHWFDGFEPPNQQ